MAIPRALPAALGAISLLPTAAILVIHIILARSPADRASSVKYTAIVAAISEAAVLAAISALTLQHLGRWSRVARLNIFGTLWLSAGVMLCTIGAAVSVASLICLSRVVDDPLSTIMRSRAADFMVGSSVVLGTAFATQLVFFIFHLVAGRMSGPGIQLAGHISGPRTRSPPVKSIPYHETTEVSKLRSVVSFESRTPPGSSGRRSVAETMSSIRSSLSHAVGPISSKTRLLSTSQRSLHRPASFDLGGMHGTGPRSTDDGFESWDTSGVDPQNRQAVIDSSSPPPPTRFLETIPDSPPTSRSPSPGDALDLPEPPRTRRRSRSYSPVSTRTVRAQRAAFTQHASQSESHIHPLFRSDSPTPPPAIATPGTVVVAAPNGGQVISERQSIRSIKSMRRMRSGSLPPVPSPLSRAASYDSFRHRQAGSGSPEIREEHEPARPGAEMERKMTPPIPEWILSAGLRTSLAVYNSRKLQIPRSEGPDLEKQSSASPGEDL
ncbi:hypothetical protein VTK26DRAFT_8027 [Humicola hyalothermophila]